MSASGEMTAMLSEYKNIINADPNAPLWLPDLSRVFSLCEKRHELIIRQLGHGGESFDYPCPLPVWRDEEELLLVRQYLYAGVFNLLSARGAREIELYYDLDCAELSALIASLDEAFGLHTRPRGGFGKVINIAERISRAHEGSSFAFTSKPISAYRPLPAEESGETPDLSAALRRIAKKADGLCLVGIDVGGTDIKLAASKRGRLICLKEYDWNPAASDTAEGIIGPILLLTRLMRACAACEKGGEVPNYLYDALRKDASDEEISEAVDRAESELGERIDVLHGIGLSFPDIVIDDRIVGGETPKTDGMRKNTALDYETEFSKLRELRGPLLRLCRPGGRVRLANDGNIAAFTAAMELAQGDEAAAVKSGVVAHTLGTDLGSGWLKPDGTIPPMPLEMYDFIIDVGSRSSALLPPEDLRSTRNENSGLAGARRYMGQSAAFRIAEELEPALLEGFTATDGDLLFIPTSPRDLRKPCLEHLMDKAQNGDPAAEEVFRRIGENLAVLTEEMDGIIHPESRERFLYGRFVKSRRCFELICEGFSRRETGITLRAADENLACTPLMRQLAENEGFTVAQFGQAVGAIYFALLS